MVIAVGFSCFLSLLFLSLCPSFFISRPSLAGPRFGMTKGKVWLIVAFLLLFLSHFLSVYRSLPTGIQEMDQTWVGLDETERDRDNVGGDSNAGQYQGAEAPDRYTRYHVTLKVNSLWITNIITLLSFTYFTYFT